MFFLGVRRKKIMRCSGGENLLVPPLRVPNFRFRRFWLGVGSDFVKKIWTFSKFHNFLTIRTRELKKNICYSYNIELFWAIKVVSVCAPKRHIELIFYIYPFWRFFWIFKSKPKCAWCVHILMSHFSMLNTYPISILWCKEK